MLKSLTYIIFISFFAFACKEPLSPREEQDFNFGWKFSLSNDIGAASVDFDDSEWSNVNLPHDWSANLPFDSVNAEGCTGYVGGGIGWYRKAFTVHNTENKAIYVLFDGIYNHSEVWFNGEKMQSHVSGYSPFYVEITDGLKSAGEENVLAVKVDRSRYLDSRWYSGSGIYRNVKLIVADKLHIPVWGTYITTPEISKDKASVSLKTAIKNNYDQEQTFDLITKIIAPNGQVVEKIQTEGIRLKKGKQTIDQSVQINSPLLWDVSHPNLYKAVSCISQNDHVIDQYTTTFGIRDIKFDAKKGFFLNGKNMKIKGLCIHADAGAVGVAVPKGVWRRRLQKLKDGGCNALRMAHHPASEELLDLCDEMGLLVQDEFFDEWNYPKDKRLNMYEQHDDYISRGYADWFEDNAEKDLKNAMLSHRNHASIFQWSIGNEIEWTYPRNRKATGFFDNMDWSGNYFWSIPPYTKERIKEEYQKQEALAYNIGETAKQLAAWTREMDTTRPVIANCILPSVSFESGYADALDIVGFSYRRVMYDYARKNYPDKTVMGTENVPQWHEWKAVADRDFVSGLFLWTGFDYLGEATNRWPVRGIASGLLDVAGFEKMAYKMYKTLWLDTPQVYIGTQTLDKTKYKLTENGDVIEKKKGEWKKRLWFWPDINEHWNYKTDDIVVVHVFTNQDSVELLLNDQSLGVKYLHDFPDHIVKWAVPYKAGILTAKTSGAEQSIQTADTPHALDLSIDKSDLCSDGYDVVHLVVQLTDDKGNPVRSQEKEISFKVDGDAKIIGVDNGSLANPYYYKGDKVITHNGKALLIVQSLKGGKDNVMITASAQGIDSEVTIIKMHKINSCR